MTAKRLVLIVALMSIGTIATARSSAAASSAYEGQKAEPNAQAPAVPQANNPANPNGGLGQPDPAANAALQGRIQQALQNEPTLSASHVSVSVTDSAIELSGTAASTKDKETAERIAQSFDGNRKFTDKLLVTGQAPGVNSSAKSDTSNSSANASNPRQ